ncbi:MAG: hypothetical protein F7B95_00290 [Desulfurococcales archaeon]|nr:hypothetical protein [Desulfurococcales archaeon]
MPKRGMFEEKIPEYVAKLASGLEDIESFESPVLARHTVEAVKRVALRLSGMTGGVIYCSLCGKGPLTKKGYYLHLTRVHGEDILRLVNREIERISSGGGRV